MKHEAYVTELGHKMWQFQCTCARVGPIQGSREEAHEDANSHMRRGNEAA